MADIVHNPQHIGGTKSRIKKKTKSMVGVQETESWGEMPWKWFDAQKYLLLVYRISRWFGTQQMFSCTQLMHKLTRLLTGDRLN